MWLVTSRRHWPLGLRPWPLRSLMHTRDVWKRLLRPLITTGSKLLKPLMGCMLMTMVMLQIVQYNQQELGAEDYRKNLENSIMNDNIKLKALIDISENSMNEKYDSLDINHNSSEYVKIDFSNERTKQKHSVENSEAGISLNNEPSSVIKHILSVETEKVNKLLEIDISNDNANTFVDKEDKCKHLSEKFLQLCPAKPPGLKGPLHVLEEVTEVSSQVSSNVLLGGSSWPKDCIARYRVAIIVPYRDRDKQVLPFLQHMHGVLQRQQLNYTIFFVQQNGSELFNRAKLLNVGYSEARKAGSMGCYVFHDVDMLPENDHNLYHCTTMPRHLVVAASNKNYEYFRNRPISKGVGMGAQKVSGGKIWNLWFRSLAGPNGPAKDLWRPEATPGLSARMWQRNIGPPYGKEEEFGICEREKPIEQILYRNEHINLETLNNYWLKLKKHYVLYIIHGNI
ncbi:unnamed protein product, partial [Meganyctiphanes norvegica]